MLTFVACFAFVTLVPLVPYAPVCGLGREGRALEGSLRPEFVEQLVVVLARDGFRFRRVGTVVLVPHADIWPNRTTSRLPSNARFNSLPNFQANTDRHLARNIAYGQLLTGWGPQTPSRTIAPPLSLQSYLRSLEPELGRYPPGRGDVDADRAWDERFTYDCALLRLALIHVEDQPDPP